jgi:hypothetical protein
MLNASLTLLQNVEQVAWDVPAHDALRETLHHGRLPHSRLANEHRVVLRAAREDAHDHGGSPRRVQ